MMWIDRHIQLIEASMQANQEQQEQERNQVSVFVSVELINNEREVTFATHHNTTRMFTVGQFVDSEHYPYLESLLIQASPTNEDGLFTVHLMMPPINSEKRKLKQKVAEYQTKVWQGKLGKGDIQLPMGFLLKKSYNYYKELEVPKHRMVLEKLLEAISIEKDPSNKEQFDLRTINPKSSMTLDKATINAIQIFPKTFEKTLLSNNNTLYDILNKCKTAFGTRCLRRWMRQPLQNAEDIQMRLDKVEYFIANSAVKNAIQAEIRKLPDLDRLYFVFYKVAAGKKITCEVSDLMKIYRVVESLNDLVISLEKRDLSDNIIRETYQEIKKNVDVIGRISKMIEKGIDMSGQKDSEYYVRPETQASLNAIMKQKVSIENQINHEVVKVAKYLGIEIEKVPSNSHKFVLEGNKKLAIGKVKQTPGYKFLTAKQTKITFVTEALTKLCERLTVVEDEYKSEQQVLLRRMFELVAGYYPVLQELSLILSELDVLTTFASVVGTSNAVWCRPSISTGLSGQSMRHPCLKNCVPNDVELVKHKTMVLTGPNMGGKSTYIRTVGVCAYLAHIGCYVPAVDFSTPIVDAIITRVGASDLQVRGISTFMSEMMESACMLDTATSNSLVLIDQLGRGTSTNEGFGMAWAICQHLHTQINPYTLFATHFHEMTRMADQIDGVKNVYTLCRVSDGKLVLEYRVEEGKMEKSYGIEVMKMLNFPSHVVQMAQDYLRFYESSEYDEQISRLPKKTKEGLTHLMEEMENELSQSNADHRRVRQEYKSRVQGLLDME